MFVGTLDTVGKVPRIEVSRAYADVAEVQVQDGDSVVVLRMTDPQLMGLSHQINQYLDRRLMARATVVVKRQTAPVGGAVG